MESIKFITVEAFKAIYKSENVKVLKNEKTGKLFMSLDNGDCFRVQQDIDSKKEMKIMISDGDISNACLVNINGGATEMFAL